MNKLFIYDQWTSKILSLDAFFLDSNIEIYEEKILEFIKSIKDKSFITAKINSSNTKDIRAIQNCGFKFIDTLITYNTKTNLNYSESKLINSSDFHIRESREEDSETVAKLAFNSFKLSRFHLDPEIDNYLACKIKYEWVLNYFNGKRGNKLFVIDSKSENKIVGFILLIEKNDLLKKNKSIIIDLISIHPKFNRIGLAFELISHASNYYKENFSKLVVGTQAVNIAANNLYQKSKFRMTKSTYIFHYHKNENR